EAITVQGIAARDGSHQAWARSMVLTATGKKVFDVAPAKPPSVTQVRPAPRGPDGKPRLGSVPGSSGYWGYPGSTSLMENGANVQADAVGLLRNIADADKVAPFQR